MTPWDWFLNVAAVLIIVAGTISLALVIGAHIRLWLFRKQDRG